MAKNEKELDEISTTDKLKAFKILKDSGLRVEFNGSGVPTVICAGADEIDKTLKNVKKLLKEIRYTGSFGVRAPRKTDMIGTDDTTELAEDMTEKREEIESLTA
ncbi:hypothetical protein SAMN04487928_12318 [Butyrivibrio proteoclasticus]|uniref:Uncharacterized protein n=1 Tax=Butyrivibrio proteoclasticus TaxID=43305 RepID=A0A1I5WJP9_9FIRM|nr:hypothetical protein [Butyrivibrio proteoclasticus]SFQ19890.1 hypothetical protein SAMN04487928_12318 [Butyrivibrio proteoclasticus]